MSVKIVYPVMLRQTRSAYRLRRIRLRGWTDQSCNECTTVCPPVVKRWLALLCASESRSDVPSRSASKVDIQSYEVAISTCRTSEDVSLGHYSRPCYLEPAPTSMLIAE